MDQDRQFTSHKKALRRTIRERILAIASKERADQQAALDVRFEQLAGYSTARTVLLYAKAFPEEIETVSFLNHALSTGKRVVCPRVDRRERLLRLYEIEDPRLDLAPGTLGIPEPRDDCHLIGPEEIDWVLVPGLAFDFRGFRLGRGAGHYDRLLPCLRPDAMCWAVGFDCQLVPELPVEPHDIPIDGIATPARLITRP
jgi:5-formyltetrahydrofolate cyclo-ligase